MFISNVVAPATPMSRAASVRLAPLSVTRMGSKSVVGTPTVSRIGNDAGVRDGEQAAPPRRELC
jgi:hypothetical protein